MRSGSTPQSYFPESADLRTGGARFITVAAPTEAALLERMAQLRAEGYVQTGGIVSSHGVGALSARTEYACMMSRQSGS